MSKYNVFVQCYNTPVNTVEGVYLTPLPESEAYETLFIKMQSYKGAVNIHLGLAIFYLPDYGAPHQPACHCSCLSLLLQIPIRIMHL